MRRRPTQTAVAQRGQLPRSARAERPARRRVRPRIPRLWIPRPRRTSRKCSMLCRPWRMLRRSPPIRQLVRPPIRLSIRPHIRLRLLRAIRGRRAGTLSGARASGARLDWYAERPTLAQRSRRRGHDPQCGSTHRRPPQPHARRRTARPGAQGQHRHRHLIAAGPLPVGASPLPPSAQRQRRRRSPWPVRSRVVRAPVTGGRPRCVRDRVRGPANDPEQVAGDTAVAIEVAGELGRTDARRRAAVWRPQCV
jgi:hypothetical protein